MTAKKNLKRRVRERAERTGESYTAALRHLRHATAEERQMSWQRVEKAEFAYAVHVPQGWEERPPDLKNSPWETARFTDPEDRRHALVVFRQPVRSGQTSRGMAERVEHSLAGAGFAELEITDTEVAGLPGARLDCVKRDAGRAWHVRQFVVVRDGVGFCLGFGSSVPEDDDPLFVTMSERFELLDQA